MTEKNNRHILSNRGLEAVVPAEFIYPWRVSVIVQKEHKRRDSKRRNENVVSFRSKIQGVG
jgi:hypothetical protein